MHEIDQTNSKRSERNQQHGNPFTAAYSLYKSLPASMQSIILGVMFCWLGVVLIAAFHPNLNERWKFAADMTLNVLILLVVAVQAYIYVRQWEVMREQKKMATIGERAYLGVKVARIDSPITNNTIVVRFLLFNGGRTPAINILRGLVIGLVEKGRSLPWEECAEIQTDWTILPAGAERWLTFPLVPVSTAQLQEFMKGDRIIHAGAEIRFSDFMGTKQIFRVEMTSEFTDNGTFKDSYQRQYDDPTQELKAS